jgi:hypothetical protein
MGPAKETYKHLASPAGLIEQRLELISKLYVNVAIGLEDQFQGNRVLPGSNGTLPRSQQLRPWFVCLIRSFGVPWFGCACGRISGYKSADDFLCNLGDGGNSAINVRRARVVRATTARSSLGYRRIVVLTPGIPPSWPTRLKPYSSGVPKNPRP